MACTYRVYHGVSFDMLRSGSCTRLGWVGLGLRTGRGHTGTAKPTVAQRKRVSLSRSFARRRKCPLCGRCQRKEDGGGPRREGASRLLRARRRWHGLRRTASFEARRWKKEDGWCRAGRLSKEQLRLALASLGALEEDEGDAALERLLSKTVIDSSHHVDGELTLREFRSLFYARRLRQLFDCIDANRSGTISAGELAAVLGRYLEVDAAEARHMVASIDTKGTGEVDFAEFTAAFEFVPAADLQSIARRWEHLAARADGLFYERGLTLWQTVVAGGASSIASQTATAPFERLKIEAQTSASLDYVREVRRILYNEGLFRGLFRGHLLNCLRVAPGGALGCTCFVSLLDREPRSAHEDPHLHQLWRMASAVISQAVVTALTYPLDALRTRWCVLGGGSESTVYVSPKSVGELLRTMLREEGVVSLFRGLAPALYAVGPFVAVQQCALDWAKSRALQNSDDHQPFGLACVGAFAGIVAQTVTYPLEVVRRRMQLGLAESVATASPVPDRTWPAIKQIVREEGLRGLFYGILPTFLMVVPSCATGYLVAISLFTHFKRQAYAAAPSVPQL